MSLYKHLHLLFFQLTGLFQYTIRLASELEARFTSVERINYYLTVSFIYLIHIWFVSSDVKEDFYYNLLTLYLPVYSLDYDRT
jgi:hypothetical protein